MAFDDLIKAERKMFSHSRNIPELTNAGSLFKYENSMPDTTHYDYIERDILKKNRRYSGGLSKKMKTKVDKRKKDD